MARIRTIKPEFPQSESMSRISREARLTFIMLWTLADDEGRLRGNSRLLASLLFPYDDDAIDHIEGWLGQLVGAECIRRYLVNKDHYVEICNWLKHQKIDKPTKSKLPTFDDGSALPREDSRELPVGSGKDLDQEGKGSKEKKPAVADVKSSAKPTLNVDDLIALDVDAQVAKDFLAVRKAKRAPLTETALNNIKSQAHVAGLTLSEALTICVTKGWQGFEASWVMKSNSPVAGKPSLLDNNRAAALEALRRAQEAENYAAE